jgi:hypothetical protein
MTRKSLLILTGGVTVCLMFCGLTGLRPNVLGGRSATAAGVADLQDQLENGLRTRSPQEIQFIQRVVFYVKRGQLPLKDVYAVFKWARPKRPHPFPYFQAAMRRLALQRGINL